jgi:hypothetical protein
MPRPEHLRLCQWANEAIVTQYGAHIQNEFLLRLANYTNAQGEEGIFVAAEPRLGRAHLLLTFPDGVMSTCNLRYPESAPAERWYEFQRAHEECLELRGWLNLPLRFEGDSQGWHFHVACPRCGNTSSRISLPARVSPDQLGTNELPRPLRIRDRRTGQVYKTEDDLFTAHGIRCRMSDLIENFEVVQEEKPLSDEKRPTRYQRLMRDP